MLYGVECGVCCLCAFQWLSHSLLLWTSINACSCLNHFCNDLSHIIWLCWGFLFLKIEMHTVRPICYFSWFGKHRHRHTHTCPHAHRHIQYTQTRAHTHIDTHMHTHNNQLCLLIVIHRCPLLFRFWTINNPIVYLMVNVIQNRIVFCHLKPCCAMTLSNRGQCPRPCGSISEIKARLINSIFSPLLRLSWIYMI
jgi:hypothetical protein